VITFTDENVYDLSMLLYKINGDMSPEKALEEANFLYHNLTQNEHARHHTVQLAADNLNYVIPGNPHEWVVSHDAWKLMARHCTDEHTFKYKLKRLFGLV